MSALFITLRWASIKHYRYIRDSRINTRESIINRVQHGFKVSTWQWINCQSSSYSLLKFTNHRNLSLTKYSPGTRRIIARYIDEYIPNVSLQWKERRHKQLFQLLWKRRESHKMCRGLLSLSVLFFFYLGRSVLFMVVISATECVSVWATRYECCSSTRNGEWIAIHTHCVSSRCFAITQWF